MLYSRYKTLAQKSCGFISSFTAKLRQINLMENIPDAKNSPTYYFQGPYRCVEKFHYTYKTFTKKRWIGQKIFEMFTKEFQAYPPEYYEKAISEGRIRVNKKQVTLEYVLKNNDCIEHDAVRIEPPVYNAELEISYQDDNFIVINKPPAVPVHVCGSYFFNTITNLMTYAFKYPKVHSVHRLDKLTSGLLILAKSQEKAQKFQTELKSNNIGKMYLARVLGNFPCQDGEEITVNKILYCSNPKVGRYDWARNEEHEKIGKTAETKFKKLWYDEATNSSLIECRPLTGRTHQIRVHCYSLGCSIINDVCYGGAFIGNPYEDIIRDKLNLPKDAETKKQDKQAAAPTSLSEVIKIKGESKESRVEDELEKKDFEPDVSKKIKPNEENENQTNNESDKQEAPKKAVEETNEENKQSQEEVKEAKEAKGPEAVDATEINDEEQTYVMEIWLHSFKYQYKDQTFETSRPYWAEKEVRFTIRDFKRVY